MPKHPYDQKKVLELLSEGSEDAFTQVFNHYRPRIFTVALRFLKMPELAEEVVQEVFLKLWIGRGEVLRILHFESYLFTMARNHIFDGMKSIAKETTAKNELAHDVLHVNGTDHLLIEKQYEQLLHDAVNQLPPQQKQIFRLAKIDGLSHQAIAEHLHISRLTVKTHMAKALHTIRQNLHHHITSFIVLPAILRMLDELP